MASKKRSISPAADACGVQKEWDEALCPICMEHPHNAVLLLCSSHAKGCRSYICDTSYRHSNCLDRFRKLSSDSSNNSPETQLPPPVDLGGSNYAASPISTSFFGNELPELYGLQNRRNTSASLGRYSDEHDPQQEAMTRHNMESVRNRLGGGELAAKPSLKCPLCRGDVLGWTVVEEVRKYLNLKPRSCTRESCTFVGNYHELRRHARIIHPRVRPAEVDLSRQQAWRRFEHQRERDDIVSTIRSAMPGAVVLGDYVIENSDRSPVEMEMTSGDASGTLFGTFFLFQMLESMESLAGSQSRSHRRAWTRHRRSAGASSRSRQRYLWGENLLGLQDQDEEGDDGDDRDNFLDGDELSVFADLAGQGTSPGPRQRRRLTHSRSS